MKIRLTACVFVVSTLAFSGVDAGQATPGSVEAHMAKAKEAAGMEFAGLLSQLCVTPDVFIGGGASNRVPPRADWHVEPVKVFDDLYFVGTKTHASWALNTRDGIILIDTLFNYAAEAQIIDGLKTLGLDPARVKYVLVSHGHADRFEGARLMQERFGAKVVVSAEDAAAIEKIEKIPGGKPKIDIIAKDGDQIMLGDARVTLVSTPGHTVGTTSFLFNVKDNGKTLAVAYQGGMALPNSGVTGLTAYLGSQHKLAKRAEAANASVVLTTHSMGDNTQTKLRFLQSRKAGEPNPFEVGKQGVARYFTVGSECAEAALARLKKPGA